MGGGRDTYISFFKIAFIPEARVRFPHLFQDRGHVLFFILKTVSFPIIGQSLWVKCSEPLTIKNNIY